MTDKQLKNHEIDALLDGAKRMQVRPDAAWFARVAQDAETELQRRARMRTPSLWRQIIGAIGGWPGLGGMAFASAAGLWIGVAPPTGLGDPAALAFSTSQTVNYLSDTGMDYALFLDEG